VPPSPAPSDSESAARRDSQGLALKIYQEMERQPDIIAGNISEL
jgi:hypothetical protein